MVADDTKSASELQAQYHLGGSANLPDDQLSTAQLQAKYGIETRKTFGDSGSTSFLDNTALIGAVFVVLLSAVVYLIQQNSK